MIRSAEHLTWEAYMVTGPVRAELALRMAAAERIMRAGVRAASVTFAEARRASAAIARCGIPAREAMRNLAAAGRALEEAGRR